ncbi:MAG TPA: hypothetical protein VI818_05725, partial [Candidatus Thermoplasmatota archaeon]|nr:hypothetical protein [Candidatus Thermoplasmatota archaeon]
TPGGHFCGDAQVTPGGRRIAALEMRTVGGFALADVTDPAEPKWLGEFVMPNSRVYDMAVVPDGRHVLLVTTDQTPSPPSPLSIEAPDGLYWRDACTPETLTPVRSVAPDPVPRPMAFILVSIANPSQPEIVEQRPIPRAGHSVFASIIDGRTLIMLSVYGFSGPLGPGDYYQFYELSGTAAGARLQFQSMVFLKGSGASSALIRVHDGWLHKHPVTKRLVAYAAGGNDFFTIDLGDLRNPRIIGQWSDPMGALHSVFPLEELWDGRHYTLLGPEFGGHPPGQPSGTLWVLDTTDPAKPVEVAAWTLPHEVEWQQGLTYLFSNHYFGVVNRTAFTSMYHGGIWAVDLSGVNSDNFTLLPSVGVFAPDNVSEKPPTTLLRFTPNFQEVIPMPDGTMIAFEGASGLYSIRFDASKPMPAPDPWPLKPVARK